MLKITDFENRYRDHIPGPQQERSRYAVLVPLVEVEGRTHLLFEVRAETLNRQPGEICFPGGRVEPGESDTDCALRETWEELAIPPAAVEVIAPLDFFVSQGNFLMQPILGRVDPEAAAACRPSPAEVKETFLVPADYFLENPPEEYTMKLVPQIPEDFPYDAIGFPDGYRWRGKTSQVPIYLWEGRPIWGMTGRIVHNLMDGMQAP